MPSLRLAEAEPVGQNPDRLLCQLGFHGDMRTGKRQDDGQEEVCCFYCGRTAWKNPAPLRCRLGFHNFIRDVPARMTPKAVEYQFQCTDCPKTKTTVKDWD